MFSRMISSKKCLLFLCILLFSALTFANVQALEITSPFFRIDKESSGKKAGEVEKLRLLTAGLYEYQKADDKYKIDPDFVPNSTGLDTLNCSGSAQFSADQFLTMAETLRECADGRTIYIVDLRQESHAFINESTAISWYGTHNWANAGMTLEEIEADEAARFGDLTGQMITAYAGKDENPTDGTEFEVDSVMLEKELVESEGFTYLRLPIQEHTWPTAETIDTFIEFVKGVDTDSIWLHFHCVGGKGRTGTLMTLYDMMKNPDVPMEDVIVRQTLLGGSYPLYTGDPDSYKAPYYEEKAKMTPLLYDYVQEQHAEDYEVSWSEWLETKGIQGS